MVASCGAPLESQLLVRASCACSRARVSGSTILRQRLLAPSEKRAPPKRDRPSMLSLTNSSRPSSKRVWSRAPEDPRNGCLAPFRSMNMVTPAAHMSTGKPKPPLAGSRCCSGAMKDGVPQRSTSALPCGSITARPKSASLRVCVTPETMKFSGFTSQWQMDLKCKAWIAAMMSRIQPDASGSVRSMLRSFSLSPKSPPSQYSSAR
mmetsp:Transcript_59155/g.152133  ORF Transcript_59155/g.152133 Transcript_59155/m.152133 type:complete len:206 (+) Transcript_59155:1037-1654(+)